MINEDFIISTMIKVMSPQELLMYRRISKQVHDQITSHIISEKIIKIVESDFRNIFAEKYDNFIDLMNKRSIIISDSYVSKIIWGRGWSG